MTTTKTRVTNAEYGNSGIPLLVEELAVEEDEKLVGVLRVMPGGMTQTNWLL